MRRMLVMLSVLTAFLFETAAASPRQSAKELSRSDFEAAIDQQIFNASQLWLACVDQQIEIEKTNGTIAALPKVHWPYAFSLIARCHDYNLRYTSLLLQKSNNFPIEGRGDTNHNMWAAEKSLDRQLEIVSHRVEVALGLGPRCTLTGTYAGSKPKRDKCLYDNLTYAPWGVRLNGRIHPERRYVINR